MITLDSFIRDEHRVWDTGTYHEVVTRDCYKLSNRKFGPSDLVIDVGANIGFFSGLALELGAGMVIAVEASPMNFARLKSNLAQYGSRVVLHCRAVWRSDQDNKVLHLNEAREDGNTGGINVVEDEGSTTVETIKLDDLIGDQQVTFLKVDCEGSEFPILYTSRKLGQVKEIMVEVHPIDHLIHPDADVRPGQNSPKALSSYLAECGFQIKNEPQPNLPEGWAYLTGSRT